jgi:alpha-D-xyloside xylohydrolase
MELASETGLPAMRPLFVDFADDEVSWTIEDQFLLGPDLLVAPVTEYGVRTRTVYLPTGARWSNSWTGEQYTGGTWIQVDAPLDRIPVFARDEAVVPVASQQQSDDRSEASLLWTGL